MEIGTKSCTQKTIKIMKKVIVDCIIIAVLCLMFVKCTEQKPNYGKQTERITQLYSDFFLNRDTIKLEQAIESIDSLIKHCYDNRSFWILKKAQFEAMLHRYDDAIVTMSTDDFEEFFIYRQSQLLNELRAQKALHNRDSVKYLYYVKKIIDDYDNYFAQNRDKIDSVLCIRDYEKIAVSVEWISMEIYFKYKSKLIGNLRVMSDVDSLEKMTSGVHERLFYNLRTSLNDANRYNNVCILFN